MSKWVVYFILAFIPVAIFVYTMDTWPFTDSKTLPKGFYRIPANVTEVNKLVEKIEPNRKLRYWQYEEWMTNESRIVRSVGDTVLQKRINSADAEGGFFSNCVPIPVCYSLVSFIVDRQVEYVTSESEMIEFIGDVDNLEEAILIAMLQGYHVDTKDVRGGCYQPTDNGFILYLAKGEDCPVTLRSVKLTLSFDGKFTVRNKEFYYQTDDCNIY